MAIRAIFSNLVNRWTKVLTPSQRSLWDVFAENVPNVDALGNSITVSGQNKYIGYNTLALQALAIDSSTSWGVVDDAPTSFSNGAGISAVSIEADVAGPEINLYADIVGGASAAGGMLVYVGPAQNPSRTYYKGPYRLGAVQDINAVASGASTTAITLNAAADTWAGPWGTVSGGDLIPVRAVMLYPDGRHAVPYRSLITVTSA